MTHEEQLYQKDLFIQKLEQKLEEQYKEIIKLNKTLDIQERHIANMEKYFRGRGTRRTGNVITDFELLIRKQICDEIREKIKKLLDVDLLNLTDCYHRNLPSYILAEILDQIEGNANGE